MYKVSPDGKEVLLCLDCYIRFRNMQLNEISQIHKEINYLTDHMEKTVGLHGILPRYPEQQPPQLIQTGGIALNNIHVSNSEIGVLNTGVIENVDSALTVLKQEGNAELAAAVTDLSEAVIKASDRGGPQWLDSFGADLRWEPPSIMPPAFPERRAVAVSSMPHVGSCRPEKNVDALRCTC
jgi:hypothetical protein